MIKRTSVIFRDEESYCGPISMLKRLQNEDLLLVFRHAPWDGPDMVSHVHRNTKTALLRSQDGGQSWSGLIHPDPDGGNGTTLNQLSDGTLVITNFRWACVPLENKDSIRHLPGFYENPSTGYASAMQGIFITRSTDNGHSWDIPKAVEVPGYEGSTTAGRVIDLDGAWLMPMNGAIDGSVDACPWIAQSTDGGETWHFLGTPERPEDAPRFSENRILHLPDSRILSMVRTPEGNFWKSHSSDAGKTWTPLEETPLNCRGSSPADLLLLEDGRVLCTYGRRRPNPKGVRASISEDGGDSWEPRNEFVLRDDAIATDMGYPSTQTTSDGSLLTIYYWHNEDHIRHLVGTWWAP